MFAMMGFTFASPLLSTENLAEFLVMVMRGSIELLGGDMRNFKLQEALKVDPLNKAKILGNKQAFYIL